MKSLITLIALLAIAGGAMAQKTALPQLKIVGERDANPMQLQELSLDIWVMEVGGQAVLGRQR